MAETLYVAGSLFSADDILTASKELQETVAVARDDETALVLAHMAMDVLDGVREIRGTNKIALTALRAHLNTTKLTFGKNYEEKDKVLWDVGISAWFGGFCYYNDPPIRSISFNLYEVDVFRGDKPKIKGKLPYIVPVGYVEQLWLAG